MQLTWLDWIVIAGYFAVNLGIGFYYMRRASGNVGEFFLSGRNVPWWLAGTSMVATTFGADTPLVVTGLVYSQGIAGNWLWWSFCLSGMLTVFFFAPLWRRARVLTDMEFAELRYSGAPATFLRAFRAVYLALPVNTIIMGWVNLAMAKVLALTLGLTTPKAQLEAVFACLALTLAYNAVSGMWAVLWTDLVQFVLKMSMVVALAVFAVKAVGGMGLLAVKVHAADLARQAAGGPSVDTLAFVPSFGSGFFLSFLVLMSLNWWASWYPGAEPGGGGYIAQPHLLRQERSPRGGRDPVVQHRPLRPEALALDRHRPGRAGVAAQPRRRPGRVRRRLRLGHDPLPAALPSRPDAGRLRRGLHVDHRHPPQPRRQLPHQRSL